MVLRSYVEGTCLLVFGLLVGEGHVSHRHAGSVSQDQITPGSLLQPTLGVHIDPLLNSDVWPYSLSKTVLLLLRRGCLCRLRRIDLQCFVRQQRADGSRQPVQALVLAIESTAADTAEIFLQAEGLLGGVRAARRLLR